MARLKVRVTKIEARRGQSGSYAIAHLAGGKRAYVWDEALAQTLSTPGIYELEAEERRGFLRIISAKPIATNSTQGHVQAQEERPQEATVAPGADGGPAAGRGPGPPSGAHGCGAGVNRCREDDAVVTERGLAMWRC
jgi:hypothetical protein